MAGADSDIASYAACAISLTGVKQIVGVRAIVLADKRIPAFAPCDPDLTVSRIQKIWIRGGDSVGDKVPKKPHSRQSNHGYQSRDTPKGASFAGSSTDVAIVKWVSAFRAELRRMGGIVRLPAAFVAFVLGYTGGLRTAAVLTEFTLVYRAAGAGPAICILRPRGTALRAEFACGSCTAFALPCAGLYRFRLFGAALGTEFA